MFRILSPDFLSRPAPHLPDCEHVCENHAPTDKEGNVRRILQVGTDVAAEILDHHRAHKIKNTAESQRGQHANQHQRTVQVFSQSLDSGAAAQHVREPRPSRVASVNPDAQRKRHSETQHRRHYHLHLWRVRFFSVRKDVGAHSVGKGAGTGASEHQHDSENRILLGVLRGRGAEGREDGPGHDDDNLRWRTGGCGGEDDVTLFAGK